MNKIDFSTFYEVSASNAGYEVVADPTGKSDYFIFRAKNWVEDSAPCDTPAEAWRTCCELNDLPVDFMLDNFTKAFLHCGLATENDDRDEAGGEPLDQKYEVANIALSSMEEMIKECAIFQRNHATVLAKAYEIYKAEPGGSVEGSAGHDFMLTLNGHGAGFWDRGLGEVGDRLTKAAKDVGECNLYVGDDSRIHAQISKPHNAKAKP